MIVREPRITGGLGEMAELYLCFLEAAIAPDGQAHNRMDERGDWDDQPGTGDWWGRLVWALGTAAAQAPQPAMRVRALDAFHRGASARSGDLRPLAYAALGAAAVLDVAPADVTARQILLDLVARIPDSHDLPWPWPEDRLRYANALLPEALIAAGTALKAPAVLAQGLGLLDFLLSVEISEGHLSVTGTRGRGPGERGAQYDQQPIEVSAIADACARAYDDTGDPRWIGIVELAWSWFLGWNDGKVVMYDQATGAGFDGLEEHGRNENRGAESTIAGISTYQQVRRLERAVRG